MKINYCKNPKIRLGDGVQEKLEDSVLDLFFDSGSDYMEAFENRGYQISFCLERRNSDNSNEMPYLPILEISKPSLVKGGSKNIARRIYLYNQLRTREEGGFVIIEKRVKPELSY